jgi:chromate reductase, NAD(P)H dehydrogenase (quinone)
MATSPGARGGITVLETAKNRFPFQGAVIKGTFSLPNFHENFDAKNGIMHDDFKNKLIDIIESITFDA